MYTVVMPDGTRNLVMEHGLQQLESQFASIRAAKFVNRIPLAAEDRVFVCAFLSALHARTPANREHWRKQMERPLQMMEDLADKLQRATDDQRRAMARSGPPRSGSATGITHDQVKQFVADPLQSLVRQSIEALTPIFSRLDMAIVETNHPIGFLTSDVPVVWADPQAQKRPPFYQHAALAYKTIEITLPISPTQCLLLNRQGLNGYCALNDVGLDALNRRIAMHADRHIVSRKATINPQWLEPDEPPPV